MAETTPDPKATDDTRMPDAAAKTDTGSVSVVPSPRPPPPKLGPRAINCAGSNRTQGPVVAEVTFKEAENIIKDLRHQLTDTRAKVTSAEARFREAAATANQRRRQLQDNEGIIKRFQVAHEGLEKDFNKLKYKYDQLYDNHKMSYQTTTDQLQESQVQQTQLEELVQNYQIRVKDLAEELKICKDELFSLQPANQISDTQISASWETLCGNIVQWIDDQAGEFNNLTSQLKILQDNDQLTQIVQLYWGRDRQQLAIRHRNILEDLLRYNIHCLLERRVFAPQVYMPGLTSQECEVLSMVERTMSLGEPRKDRISIDMWRSEALTALSVTSTYPSRQTEFAKLVTMEAQDFLEPVLPKRGTNASKAFHREVTVPAVNLACTLRRSSASYEFIFMADPKLYQNERPPLETGGLLFPDNLGNSNIIDIETRKTVRPGRVEQGKDGSIGNRVMMIHPALYRRRGNDEILLGKQLLLAQLPESSHRLGKPRNNEGSRNLISGLFNGFSS